MTKKKPAAKKRQPLHPGEVMARVARKREKAGRPTHVPAVTDPRKRLQIPTVEEWEALFARLAHVEEQVEKLSKAGTVALIDSPVGVELLVDVAAHGKQLHQLTNSVGEIAEKLAPLALIVDRHGEQLALVLGQLAIVRAKLGMRDEQVP